MPAVALTERDASAVETRTGTPGVVPSDVVVLAGSDGVRAYAGSENASVVRAALRAAGDHADVVPAGRELVQELAERNPDFVFPCLFGELGGDGVLQDALELLGLQYVGSRANAVRSCADKAVTKRVLAAAGLPTPAGRIVARRTSVEWGAGAAVPRIAEDLGLPVIVKPARGSAGMGVKLVRGAEDIARVVSGVLLYDSEALIEPFLRGREVSVVVVERDGSPEVLGIAEVRHPPPHQRIPATWLRTYAPASAEPANRSEIARLATEAFVALGCRDYASVDLIIDESGDPWLLEVDTTLEFAGDGKLAAAAAAAGMSPADAIVLLCERCRTSRGRSAVGE